MPSPKFLANLACMMAKKLEEDGLHSHSQIAYGIASSLDALGKQVEWKKENPR